MYVHLIDQLDAMLRDGQPLDTLEDWIERQPLTPEQKSALWLYAWAKLPDRDRQLETLNAMVELA